MQYVLIHLSKSHRYYYYYFLRPLAQSRRLKINIIIILLKRYKSIQLAKPIAIEVNGDEGRWYSEVIDERVEFDQKNQLLRGSDKLQHYRHKKGTRFVADLIITAIGVFHNF